MVVLRRLFLNTRFFTYTTVIIKSYGCFEPFVFQFELFFMHYEYEPGCQHLFFYYGRTQTTNKDVLKETYLADDKYKRRPRSARTHIIRLYIIWERNDVVIVVISEKEAALHDSEAFDYSVPINRNEKDGKTNGGIITLPSQAQMRGKSISLM